MAENVKVGIEVSDNGTAGKTQKNVQNLKDVLDQTAVSAGRVGKAVASAASGGRRSGTEAVMAAAAGGSDITGPDLREYNRLRGAAAVTGAGARDFANQAQGLGGLVRLYATFAANIFAVSAAYENLNKAAQFERLMRASDMMSVQVGINLKAVGKGLQEATGYAISFEDAMQFTNLGVSAGLAAKDIQNLVVIAKGAAAGLGRDVNDSIRRIIQGTAKQEQEILDELGIFIKAKQAYEDYAKAFDIKGGADALSAQQRVAAYAQAVEKAGEKWKEFATLEDPFAKFTAKGKEAINTILQAINSVLVPILDVISKSGDAIIAIILAASGLLLKRAVPELKGLVTDIFTFDKDRAKSQANAARLEVLKEYSATTTQLEALKKQRDAIIAPEPAKPSDVAARIGGMAGVARGEIGIFPQKLTTRLIGEGGENLANIKSVSDIEKNIASTLKEQYKSRKDQDAVIQALVDKKIVEQGSTLKNLVLTKESKALSADIFNLLNIGNAESAKKLSLTEKIVLLETRLLQLAQQKQQVELLGAAAAPTPGAPVAGGRTGRRKPTQAPGPAVPITDVAVTNLYKSMSVGEKVSQGWSQGIAKSADNLNTLNLTADKSWKESLKNFGGILVSNLDNIGKVGQGLGFFGRTAAIAGSALSTLGLIATGVFRAIASAFGPIMIAWSLWELVGPKLLDSLGFNYTQNQKLKESQEELSKSITLVGDSFARLNQIQSTGSRTNQEYSLAVQVAANNIDSLINSLDELLTKQDKVIAQKERDKALDEARKSGREFSNEAFAIQQILKSGLYDPKLKKDLQELAFLFEENANSTENDADSKRKLQIRLREVAGEQKKFAEQEKAYTGTLESARKASQTALDEILNRLKNRASLQSKLTTQQAESTSKYLSLLENENVTVEKLEMNYKDLVAELEKLRQISPEAGRALQAITEARTPQQAITFFRTEKYGQKIAREVDVAAAPYSIESQKGFEALENSIKSIEMALISLDTALGNVSAQDKRNQSVRGYAAELEIARQKQFELAKAEQEYQKTLKQIDLDLRKITEDRTKGGEDAPEKQRARALAGQRRAEALAVRNQKVQRADLGEIENNIQRKLQEITKEYGIQAEKNKVLVDLRNNYFKYDDLALQIAKETNSLSQKDLVLQQNSVDLAKLEAKYEADKLQLAAERKKEEDEIRAKKSDPQVELQALREVKDKYTQRKDLLDTIRSTDINILGINTQQKLIQAEFAEKLKEINSLNDKKEQAYSVESQLLSVQKDLLKQQFDQGKLTQDQYNTQLRALEENSREMEYQNNLRKILVERERALQQIYAEEERVGELTPELSKRLGETIDKYDGQVDGLKRVKRAQDEVKNSQEILLERQQAYTEVFNKSVDSMTDALVDFARTGKLSFKSLIDSMIADLIRFEIRQIMMNATGGGRGIFSLLTSAATSIFGGGGGTIGMGYNPSAGRVQAKGGVWDGGIQKFAKGEMFTNSVVDSPTVFRFAKGIGLMGEAGPEAIMPLKRDSQGNLGVRGNSGSVEVVVNNYTTERAETRETTDSRGNRKIEVIVGDMVAGEMTRTGSNSQRAVRGTFGLQPQLIRR